MTGINQLIKGVIICRDRLALIFSLLLLGSMMAPSAAETNPPGGDQTVSGEHAQIGVAEYPQNNQQTHHPGAQWFPDTGLGLFIYWDEGSVQGLETSWPMMAGRGRNWAAERKLSKNPMQISQAEFERIVRVKDAVVL